MKKKTLFIILGLFLLPISAFAEAVVKTPFSGITNSYQATEDTGYFIKNSLNNSTIYDNLGNSIDSQTHTFGNYTVGNTDYMNVYFPKGDIMNFTYGTQSFNYNGYAYELFIDISVPEISRAQNIYTGSRYCRTGYKYAINDSKLIYNRYRAYNNNSSCSASDLGTFEVDITDPTNTPVAYTGGVVQSQMVNETSIDNNMIQIIGEDWIIYKKTSDPDIIYQLVCNEFDTCTESPFLDLQITNSGSIQNFKHFYYDDGTNVFGGLNIHVGDGTSGNLQFATYDFDENNAIVGISAFEMDKWVQKVFLNSDGSYKLFIVNPITMGTDGLDFDMAKNPLILYDEDGSDLDFWYVKDAELYNWGTPWTGGSAIGSENGDGDSSGGYSPSVCDTDEDGSIGIGEAVGCIPTAIGSVFSDIFSPFTSAISGIANYVDSLKEFFSALFEFGNPSETKTFGLLDWIVPTSYASDPTTLDVINAFGSGKDTRDDIVSNAFNFIKYLLLGSCFIMLIVLLILIRHKND